MISKNNIIKHLVIGVFKAFEKPTTLQNIDVTTEKNLLVEKVELEIKLKQTEKKLENTLKQLQSFKRLWFLPFVYINTAKTIDGITQNKA